MRSTSLALAVLTACLAAAGPARATTVRRLALPELVARAERVVLARCVAVEPAPPAASGLAATAVTFTVQDTLKGPPAETLTIRQLGRPGSGPAPAFRTGEEVVLFLPRASALGFTHPVGLEQGRLGVRRRPGAGPVVLGQAALAARTDRAGAPSPDELPLDVLLDAVRALVTSQPR
jgi:hypothetical protein